MLVAAAIGIGVVLLTRSHGAAERTVTIGPEGGRVALEDLEVRIPRGAVAESTRVRVVVDEDVDATMYDSVSRSRAGAYEVNADRPLRRPAELRFRLQGVRDARRLIAATRDGGGRGWGLVEGRGEADRLTVTTRDLSWWQPRELKGGLGLGQRALGGRVDPSNCPADPLSEFRVVVADPRPEPRLFACPATVEGRFAVRVVNNRAAALEYEPPRGVRVHSVDGRSISEEIWELIFVIPGSGNGHLVPASGGEVLLTGDFRADDLTFRTSVAAATYDAALAAISTAGEAGLAVIAKGGEALECIHDAIAAINEAPPSFGAFLAGVRDVFAGCASVLPSKVLVAVGKALGRAEFVSGIWDAMKEFGGPPATVRVERRPASRLPEVRPADELHTGEPCGAIGLRPPPGTLGEGATANGQAFVARGTLRCSVISQVVPRYLAARTPDACRSGGNTCQVEVQGWTCSSPTTSWSPLLIRCSQRRGEFFVYDGATFHVGAARTCSKPPIDELESNLGRPRANVSCKLANHVISEYLVARVLDLEATGGWKDKIAGFTCTDRDTGYESSEVTCRYGAREVRFGFGA